MANTIRTRKELEDKIKEIFGIDTISLLISNQITKYVTEYRYTYLEIARALFYHFKVMEGDINQCKGIGIVPYVIQESRKYFSDLEKQVKEQTEQAQKLKEQEQSVILCKNTRKRKTRNRNINIESIKEADDEH